jgi:dUTP pyrophosphatase
MKEYILRIITDNEDIANLYKNHSYYNEGDSGIDLFCLEDIVIKSGETKKINFNISCEILCIEDNKKINISYFLLPRSSIVKTPLRMSNSIGLIDSFYRNNLIAYVDNIKSIDYKVKKGTRLFQLIVPSLKPFKQIEVSNCFLNPNKNRNGGFGSTNKK